MVEANSSFIVTRPKYNPEATSFAEAEEHIQQVIDTYLYRYLAALGLPEMLIDVQAELSEMKNGCANFKDTIIEEQQEEEKKGGGGGGDGLLNKDSIVSRIHRHKVID
jgi:hypothetical protein